MLGERSFAICGGDEPFKWPFIAGRQAPVSRQLTSFIIRRKPSFFSYKARPILTRCHPTGANMKTILGVESCADGSVALALTRDGSPCSSIAIGECAGASGVEPMKNLGAMQRAAPTDVCGTQHTTHAGRPALCWRRMRC